MVCNGRKIPAAFSSLILLAIVFIANSCSENVDNNIPQHIGYEIVEEHPHDTTAFTQGLTWEGGEVVEGTGLLGRSSLRLVDLTSGQVKKKIDLAKHLFGEGVTVFDGKIFQLTWKNKLIIVRDKNSLELIEMHPYPHQGWGLTHDNTSLIASDGSSTLLFLNPTTFKEEKRIKVQDGATSVTRLNELEYINGRIYANIYKSDRIAVINPSNGKVDGWIDLSGLSISLRLNHKEAILNGIMYDKLNDKLFVTGKFWPKLYEIRLVPEVK